MISWALSAFLLQEYLLSNWLDVMQKERLEDPVETAQDILNRGLGVVVVSQYQLDLISPIRELANRTGVVHVQWSNSFVCWAW